ncbi:MAG TPA: hypothetical protein VN253_23865 [Kofleriaceae bacterium]|nr:hypothetical protein [Kofleriaceae bacterium]
MSRWLAAVAVLALASPAAAAPKGAPAKAAFDRGVVAYQKGDFAAAAEALGASFKLEADVETLFAWAQSERQLEHCDKAVELFTKLLGFDLPAENKKVVQSKIDECKAIIAAQPPKEPVPTEQPKPAEPAQVVQPPPVKPPPPGRSPWWKDPIGDGLVGAGIVGLGAGAFFLVSARQAEQDSLKNIGQFEKYDDRAQSRGKLGVISSIVGGVLVAGGIVRYATHYGGEEHQTVTGWLTPDGGGIAAFGRF